MGEKMERFFWSKNLDHKDWLLLWSTIVFFGFVSVGLISILIGRGIEESYIDLLQMVSPVIMVIVGGVFGVNAVTEFKRDNGQQPREKPQTPPNRSNEYRGE